MKKNNKDKEYSQKDMVKAIYKSILKNIKESSYRSDAQAVVADILDPNSVAQVDPDKIPSKKANIMNKAKGGEKERRKGMASRANSKRRKANTKTGTMKDGKKFTYPDDPRSSHNYGINKPFPPRSKEPGESRMGHKVRNPGQWASQPKEDAKNTLEHLKRAPKPDLPKSEAFVSDMIKTIKGVHTAFETKAKRTKRGFRSEDVKGKSHMGHWARYGKQIKQATSVGGNKTKEEIADDTNAAAKAASKRKLTELKGMPKPDLPKSEKGINKLKKFQKSVMEKREVNYVEGSSNKKR